MKKKKVVFDADFLIYTCTQGKEVTHSYFAATDGLEDKSKKKIDLKPLKKKFYKTIEDIMNEMYAGRPGEISKKAPKLLFSDPKGNFRYDLYPAYKNNRSGMEKSPEFYALRKWALKKFGYHKRVEADDLCWHYLKKGYICVSMDKDIRLSLAGTFFNPHYMHRYFEDNSEIQARNFTLLQSVMGDATDGIPGIKGVGEKTAIKLLDEFGWTEEGAIAAYESKGLGREDWLLTYRLVSLKQYDVSKKKLRLHKV